MPPIPCLVTTGRVGAMLLLAAFASAPRTVLAQAGQPAPPQSRVCAACHGAMGLSTLVDAPHLAGQPLVYLVEQLKNYRSGKRSHEVMSVIAKPLSDNDIADLAAWYSSITIEIKAPR